MQTEHLNISPFNGTVTVAFSDAIIASTTHAQVICVEGEPDVFYVPFEDIYFEMLTKSHKTVHRPDWGIAHFWSVSAVGEAAHDVMWAYPSPEPAAATLANHGAFNPEVARISAVSAEHGTRSTNLPA
ncbi:DUF427 domain-containing protein [Aminobacter carboxidus]|uniref:DUF427 domain-containing protein n=1 Tax=Aminobacter carboxidus TaxID=376165 RepID=A0A8E1WJI5_9HYPH|nr:MULTISPECIES: DUF427 domain-containing protein [Aminobacter carboxidus group]MBB6468769.1 uncharacterized protein (DUF427 family) [Aminobacter lissarensis]MBE1206250.1 DUF427 domain-containing protein [Aminobacter carboxidus]